MSRSDALLNTGLSSAAARRLATKKEETKVDNPDPKAEQVIDEIKKIKQEVVAVNHFDISTHKSDEEVRRDIQRARDRFEDLSTLEARMRRLLNIREVKS